MGRRRRDIRLRFKYAVLGDGRTEQYYLNHLKLIFGYKYTVKPSLFDNISLLEAEELIDELLKGGCNKIIFFTDYDTVVNQQKKQAFDRFVKKYRKYDEVIICESMPSIEFWFLLHYQYTTRPFQNAKEAEDALKKHLPNYSKEQRTFLKNPEWVTTLCNNGRLSNAIKNAKKVIADKDSEGEYYPFTKIFMAFDEFSKQKENDRMT